MMGPLEPPEPPVHPGRGYVYDPARGDFARWLDPKGVWARRYGNDAYGIEDLDYLTDEFGGNASLDFGGQIITGIRSHHVVIVPNLSRARNFSLPTGPGRYPNLDATFNGIPVPIRDGHLVSYNAQVAHENLDSDLETSTPGTWPITRVDEDGTLTELGAEATFAETRHLVVTDLGAPSPVHQVEVQFTWVADSPGADRGHLDLYFHTFVYGESPDGVDANDINSDTEAGAGEQARWNLLADSNVTTADISIPFPRPTTGQWGSYEVYETPGDAFFDWGGHRNYVSVGGYTVWGDVMSNADYQAAHGEPLPGSIASDDSINGAYRILVPFDPDLEMRGYDVSSFDRTTSLRALAAEVPIMYQGEHGTIPRPYATTTGTFLGIAWEADGTEGAETFVACDAFVLDGHTYGLVVHQPTSGDATFAVSVDGVEAWSGLLVDVFPPGDGSPFDTRFAFPAQPFLLPGWPFNIGAICRLSDLDHPVIETPTPTVFRPRYSFERWTDCPVVPL